MVVMANRCFPTKDDGRALLCPLPEALHRFLGYGQKFRLISNHFRHLLQSVKAWSAH